MKRDGRAVAQPFCYLPFESVGWVLTQPNKTFFVCSEVRAAGAARNLFHVSVSASSLILPSPHFVFQFLRGAGRGNPASLNHQLVVEYLKKSTWLSGRFLISRAPLMPLSPVFVCGRKYGTGNTGGLPSALLSLGAAFGQASRP